MKGVYVDREGSTSYTLRPAIDSVLHRLVVDVELDDKIKVVTFRSARVILNSTNVEIEIAFSRSASDKKPWVVKVKPGEKFPIPIESSYHDSVYVRPADFGYKWSMQGIHWRDLVGKKRIGGNTVSQLCIEYLVSCPSYEENTPFFNFQMNCEIHGNDAYWMYFNF